MQLDRMQARIRPRRPWEAVDLGYALVGAWRGPIYRAWLAAVLPVVVLVGALGYRHPVIAAVVLWWIKPLLDRLPLHFMSRALFGEMPPWRSLMRDVPRLWTRRLPRALLGDRLNPARSFTMPVDQLEALRGPQRRARLRIIGRRHWEEGLRLTLTSFAAEIALALGLVSFVGVLLPEGMIVDQVEALFSDSDEAGPQYLAHLWLAAQTLSMLLLEPLYVAAGFCLYLNRRTQLEAWDIEIAFRRLGARLAGRIAAGGRAAAIAMLVLAAAAWIPCWGDEPAPVEPPPGAQAPTSPAPTITFCEEPACIEAHRAIQDVLADPVFGETTREMRWHLRKPGPEDASADGFWLRAFGAAMGSALEPVLWSAALLCLVAFVVMRLNAGASASTLDLAGAEPGEVLGLDLRRHSLPGDIPAEARRLHLAGESAAAVSLLFRGALADLAVRDRLPFLKGMTEGECVRLARRAIETGRAAFFELLASEWTTAAYGHRPLAPDRVDDLIAGWTAHFRSLS